MTSSQAVFRAGLVVLMLITSNAAANQERVNLFGRSTKLQNCEALPSITVKKMPEPASLFLRFVCAKDSQYVIAASEWEILWAGDEEAIFASYYGNSLKKDRLFDFVEVRTAPAEEAKSEFLSHYNTDRKVILIGETEPQPDPFAKFAKENAENQFLQRPLGDTATVVELAGADGVRHTIYLFVNGEQEFSAAMFSTFGDVVIKGGLVVKKRN